jgi:hypothetical protein
MKTISLALLALTFWLTGSAFAQHVECRDLTALASPPDSVTICERLIKAGTGIKGNHQYNTYAYTVIQVDHGTSSIRRVNEATYLGWMNANTKASHDQMCLRVPSELRFPDDKELTASINVSRAACGMAPLK